MPKKISQFSVEDLLPTVPKFFLNEPSSSGIEKVPSLKISGTEHFFGQEGV